MGYRREIGALSGQARMPRIRRVLLVILLLNLMVAGAKLIWGYLSGSIAMQADGFHSLFDGTSNVIGLIGIYLASRPADRDHPYGHGKYETYASVVIGGVLALAAWHIWSSAITKIMTGAEPATVGPISFAVMFVTLAINVAVTVYERRVGRELKSDLLLADANHTASDVMVSVGVILGLVATALGFPLADPLIGILVGLVIARTALAIVGQAAETLSDAARIPPGVIQAAARSVAGVLGTHHIRTRGLSSEVYVDLHVQVDENLTVAEGHAIAEAVERAICHRFPQVVDVISHLEPMDKYQSEKSALESDVYDS